MADKSFFGRLQNLFSSSTIIRKAGDKKLKVGSLGVRWGKPLAIDSNHTIISAGDTSTNLDLIKTRYGDRLERYATCP